jgi:TonB family protein
MKLRPLFLLLLVPLAAHAMNDFWLGCRYSVILNFGAADLGKKNAPQPISVPSPPFPADLMVARVPGQVVVDFTVGVDGRISEAKIVSASAHELGAATLPAVSSWTFKPAVALKDSAPVSARMRCKIQFLIEEEEGPNQMPEPTPDGVAQR